MRLKTALCGMLGGALCALLCGCSIFPANTDELLSPPGLVGDDAAIAEALKSAAGSDCVLQYPAAGDRRSSIVRQDLDGDGAKEAFAFYRKGAADETMHLNLICARQSGWRSVADLEVTAGNVERIDFCDLDGDGVLEILVGWDVLNATEKTVGVYDWTGKELQRLTAQPYTQYCCCDLAGTGTPDLLIQRLSAAENTNRAALFRFSDGGVTEISSCMMDRAVKSIQSVTVSATTSGVPAVYVEELKSAGAVTEVLLSVKGELSNPLLDRTAAENIRAAHPASLSAADINHDGVPEIPVAVTLPSVDADSAEQAHYTEWRGFDGEGLIEREVWLIDFNDDYVLKIPEKWTGKLMVRKDAKQRRNILFAMNPDGTAGEWLLDLQTADAKEWDAFPLAGYTEVLRIENRVVAAKTTEGTPLALTMAEVRAMISRYEQGENLK